MPLPLKISIAQQGFTLGSIKENTNKVLDVCGQALQQGAELIVFSELALTGAPASELLEYRQWRVELEQALIEIAAASDDIAIVVGFATFKSGQLHNSVGFFADGQCQTLYNKVQLSHDALLNEQRYFQAGFEAEIQSVVQSNNIVRWRGISFALLLGEEGQQQERIQQAKDAGANIVLNPCALPFYSNSGFLSISSSLPIIQANTVGAQDELVFAGASQIIHPSTGSTKTGVQQLPKWQEALMLVHWQQGQLVAAQADELPLAEKQTEKDHIADIYQALVVGLRDYVNKSGFKGVLLGLSGGIDSALTLAIAADALGADAVTAVMMPFTYTAAISQEDAAEQAKTMGVNYKVVSIEPLYQAFILQLAEEFGDKEADTTEQNLQARCRGTLLMALSNQTGHLVLTTSNKSETAVGYSTLYGDMAGGFCALKDVYKTQVYELARHRNSMSAVIPERVIEREPSAELAPGQKDQDSLPPYDVLDEILLRYIEENQDAAEIIAAGFSELEVKRILRLVDINEYKRRQSPVGVRVSKKSLGRDRGMPITR